MSGPRDDGTLAEDKAHHKGRLVHRDRFGRETYKGVTEGGNAWTEIGYRPNPKFGSAFISGGFDNPVCEDCGTSIDDEKASSMYHHNLDVTCPDCAEMRDFGRSESADARNSAYYDYRE